MNKKVNMTDERNYFKPFEYAWAYDYWLTSEQMHWMHTELPMYEDVHDWNNKLTDSEKSFLTNIFRFFTQADTDVASGYIDNYLPFLKQPEIRMMLLSFANREALHQAAYSHLVETLGMPESTYKEFAEYEEMAAKHEYVANANQDVSKEEKIALDMAIFSGFTEGMQLFSSFIMLLNFQRRGLMKNMGQIISWSVADETLHVEGMVKVFHQYRQENKHIWTDNFKGKIYTIATEMTDLEDKFIDLAFNSADIEGLTSQEVKTYIRYICDRRLLQLGLKPIHKIEDNPLQWVEEILNGVEHTNFFENKPTSYAKGAIEGSMGNVWGAGYNG